MKPTILKSSFLVFTLMLCFASCRKTTVINEVKINDFTKLSEEFKVPAAEYTTSPFFVWNYKITKEEIDSYMNDFKNAGSSQVFVHPRPGLITEYLSDEWFDLFKYTVDKGKEMGMRVWIYDENSYPSGFAGGHVPDQMPESYNQGQGLKMIKTEMLPDTADKFFICLRDENGILTNITSSLENNKGEKGNYYLFTKTYNEISDWYGGFSYVDLLYPGVTEKFLEITMEGYEKYTIGDFRQTVPGIFTDEPHINSPGGIRWTPDLFDLFLEKWEYDLRLHLPSLFEEVGDWKKVRHNYTQTLLRMFIERWSKPYYYYCEDKGLKFTGHYWEHEWPNMRNGGDNMAMYAWHQVPAIDMLFNQWDDSTVNAQFGNVRSVKELASAANQTGRQRKLSETYGGGGWEDTFTDLKRLGDWEYALGVNLMNQHLSHISLAGARKYDYPPSFSYHEPWWKDYKYLNDNYARLSAALSAGKQKNDILVLEPTTSAWLYDSYAARNLKCMKIGQSFQTFVTMLEKNQVEYDLGSENIIKDLGSVKAGQLLIGKGKYSTVVLPPMTENLDEPTFKLISKFVAGGGKLICFSHPTLIDGRESDHLTKFFQINETKISFEKELNKDVIRKYFTDPSLHFSYIKGGDLYHHRRKLSDGQVIFLVNSSLKDNSTGTIKMNGAQVIEMNSFTGEITGYPYSQEERSVEFQFKLPPAGSLLLYIPSVNQGDFKNEKEEEINFDVVLSSAMTVKRDAKNVLTIGFCDLETGGELLKDQHTYDATETVFKAYGFSNGNPWNHSVQFKTNITDRDTFGVNTGFRATYHFNIKGNVDFTGMEAVVERPYLWDVSINGKEVKAIEGKWWLDREFGVFDIEELVKRGDNVITLKVSPMNVYAEIEPVYILGEFSLSPASKGWVVEPEVGYLQPGSWKDQGMPFYSGGITYSRNYNIENPEGKYIVSPGKWSGTVSEVIVNDKPAGIIAFPPFRRDITDHIKQGENKVEVRVLGSLKNLLGPHFNNPAPGLVSPWHFRNVKTYPPGKDYQLLDYGLMGEFELLHGK